MSKKVTTEAELGNALKKNEEEIEIVGDLANKVLKIRATGKVAWVVALGAIAIAAYSTAATVSSGGTSGPVTIPTTGISAFVSTAVLGGTVTYSAIAIAIAAGSVSSLTKVRKYKQVSYEKNRLLLKRR